MLLKCMIGLLPIDAREISFVTGGGARLAPCYTASMNVVPFVRRAPLWALLSLTTGCNDPTTPTDAAPDLAVDTSADSPVDGPTDGPVDIPIDGVSDGARDADASEVGFVCPRESLDPVFSQPCSGFEGVECRYGYTVPGCGGRTHTCRGGRWNEVHTDPAPGCFDAGPDGADAATDTSGDAPSADTAEAGNPCLTAGGICVGGTNCAGLGGTPALAGNVGCHFSDGDGTCCVPPAAQPTGDTCATHGGLCAPIAGCNFVGGAFAPPRCTGVGMVCCVPRAVCGEERQVCCAPGGSATFRPSCDRGAFRCTIDGTTLMPRDRCP